MKRVSIADWQVVAQRLTSRVLRELPPRLAKPRFGRATRGKGLSLQASVLVVGDRKMRELNRSYRGKDYATDVLSFEAPLVFRAQGVLGELVICLPVLKRQARERGLRPEEELRVLIVHGVLHLLGFDHEKGEKDARLMQNWEARLLPKKLATSGLIHRTTVASG